MKNLRVSLVGLFVVTSMLALGCASEQQDENKDEPTAQSSDAITNGARNFIIADRLWLRTGDATNAPLIGAMPFTSTMEVTYVDWGSGMAYGYSYNLGRWGWANKNYLSVALYGGGGEG